MFQPAAPALPAYAGVRRPELAVAGRCDGEPIGPSRIETPGDPRPAGQKSRSCARPRRSGRPDLAQCAPGSGVDAAEPSERAHGPGAPAHLGAPAWAGNRVDRPGCRSC